LTTSYARSSARFIESRGLVIKTNNLTNALSADIKSIAKRQQGYERRPRLETARRPMSSSWSSSSRRSSSAVGRPGRRHRGHEQAPSRRERAHEGKTSTSFASGQADRQTAELRSAKFSDLVKQGKRLDLIKGWESMRT